MAHATEVVINTATTRQLRAFAMLRQGVSKILYPYNFSRKTVKKRGKYP